MLTAAYHSLDDAAKRIEASGEQNHGRWCGLAAIVAELKIPVECGRRSEATESELVFVLRQKAQELYECSAHLRRCPEPVIAHRNLETQLPPPVCTHQLDIMRASVRDLVGDVDHRGNLDEVNEPRGEVTVQLASEVVKLQSHVAMRAVRAELDR